MELLYFYGMSKHQFFKIIYWLIASLLLAFLIQNSIPVFWNAWLIALFILPIAFIVKYGIEKINSYIGFKKGLRYFFLAIVSLYWGYIAITIAYWYFLELKGDSLEKTLINPIFIWIIIGFFILLEYVFFKKSNLDSISTVAIYSDRKRIILDIKNIAFIESRGSFTIVFLQDGSQYKNKFKISEWEYKLNEFIRIHRAFIVNPNVTTLNGNEVIVQAEWTLPISRSYKQKVVNYFKSRSI